MKKKLIEFALTRTPILVIIPCLIVLIGFIITFFNDRIGLQIMIVSSVLFAFVTVFVLWAILTDAWEIITGRKKK